MYLWTKDNAYCLPCSGMAKNRGSRDVLLVKEILVLLKPDGTPQAHFISVNLAGAHAYCQCGAPAMPRNGDTNLEIRKCDY